MTINNDSEPNHLTDFREFNKKNNPYFKESEEHTVHSPIRFIEGIYSQRFSRYWWWQVISYPFYQLYYDVYSFYHRGRYGWAPRDVWSLDTYLSRILGATLDRLNKVSHSYPFNYSKISDPTQIDEGSEDITDDDKDNNKWQEDLQRWSTVFGDSYYFNMNSGELAYNSPELDSKFKRYIEKEKQLQNDIANAMKEIGMVYGHLWD